MKKHLLSGFLLLTILGANAQDVIASNDFGTDNASLTAAVAGWTRADIDGDTDTWGYYLDDSFTQLGFTGIVAASASFLVSGTGSTATYTPVAPYNGYISPLLDLSDYASSTLTFKLGAALGTGAVMGYSVIAITEAQSLDTTFDISSVTPVASGTVETTGADDMTVDLSAYAGENIYLLFIHNDDTTGLGYLILDDIVITASTAAGVNHVLDAKFSVYPNPSSSFVNIAANDATLVKGVTVIDMNGRTVLTAPAQNQVNISGLAAGVYTMNIVTDKGVAVKKIVKQ